jgi:hypothetical protein
VISRIRVRTQSNEFLDGVEIFHGGESGGYCDGCLRGPAVGREWRLWAFDIQYHIISYLETKTKTV